MLSAPKTPHRLVALVALACALGTAGCSEADLRPTSACTPSAGHANSVRPYHEITIDNVKDFHPQNEQVGASGGEGRARSDAYVTWDECTLYLGYESTAFGADASAHRYLTVYFNTDPLGEDGVDDPKDYGVPRPKLPFHAEYLLEVRTDGHTEYEDGSAEYRGNVQLYRARGGWGRGLMKEWEPLQPEGLAVGHGRDGGFVEIALPRDLIGDPCAVEVVGWVVDEESDSGFGYWPPPLDLASPKAAPRGRSGLALTDSLALDYWGFMLRDGETPSAEVNLNRTDYAAVGECAYGTVHDA